MFVRNIQYLRAFAAIAVIFVHIHVWEQKAVADLGITPSWFAIGDAGVDLFFVISGFIMVFIQPVPISTRASYFHFLANRVTRIYPPYWLVLAPLIPIWLKWPQLFNNNYHNQVDFWRSLLLLPQQFTPLLMPAWTLIHELYFYLIVSFALLFGFRGRLFFGAGWFLVVITGFYFLQDRIHIPLLQLVFSPFSLTFLLGYFIGLFRPRLSRIPRGISLAILLMGFASLLAGVHYMPGLGVYPNNNFLYRFAGYGLPCSLIVAAAVSLETPTAAPVKILLLLGDASYSIYLLHLPIISGIYLIVRRLGLHAPWELVAAASACLVLCLMASVLFHRHIERHVIRFFRNHIDRLFLKTGART